MRWMERYLTLALCLAMAACAGSSDPDDPEETIDYPELTDLDVLMEGVPDKADLLDEKTDIIPPAQFDLIDSQSPVKSQGRRGICSIFASTALMEHLHILEGSYPDPDFSEQYLQWSVKFQVKAFPNTSGSNAHNNLRAIADYGIVEEDYWPYEVSEWGLNRDPDCDGGTEQPTRCYTNGSPPQAAVDAQKWRLPTGRYISTKTDSLKAFMVNKQQAVQVGGSFFYQAWNHGRSELPVNSSYSRNGYVLYPNAEDQRISLEKRVGHSYLIVGWDDDLAVAQMDKNGKVVRDDLGNPINERGFFLFKNSWGTGSWGSENPMGRGYGWISYRYVEEFLSARTSDLPRIEPPQEICGDELDNDRDGDTDCDDTDCQQEPQCQNTPDGYENSEATDIPDNDAEGISSEIEVAEACTIASLSLSVDISHSYRGDLEIRLQHPDGSERQITPPSSEAVADLIKTFVEERFNGKDAQGIWVLKVIDHASYDTGTLNRWSLQFVCGDPVEPTDTNLFFSEYIEGSSNNKALEIVNGAEADADLSHCSIVIYSNGASAPTSTIDLAAGTLVPAATFVICNSLWGGPTEACQQSTGSLNFNGDDAVELICQGQTMDVIGKIGERLIWGTDVSTQNQTLRRQCTVVQGDTDGSDSFSPADEWDAEAIDTFDDLGQHCP